MSVEFSQSPLLKTQGEIAKSDEKRGQCGARPAPTRRGREGHCQRIGLEGVRRKRGPSERSERFRSCRTSQSPCPCAEVPLAAAARRSGSGVAGPACAKAWICGTCQWCRASFGRPVRALRSHTPCARGASLGCMLWSSAGQAGFSWNAACDGLLRYADACATPEGSSRGTRTIWRTEHCCQSTSN